MTESQEFCLRWNNHQATIISVFDYLLENETLVDCTLAAEGQYLKAHKVVLCACSPYLEILLSQHNDKHPILIFKDIKYHELKCMIEYMYKGEVNIAQDQLNHFLKAAESLQIKGLSESEDDAAPQTAVPAPRPPPPRAPPVQRTPARSNAVAVRSLGSNDSSKRLIGRSEAQSPTPSKRRRPAPIPGRSSISGDDASNASEGPFDQSNCDVPTPAPSDNSKAVAKVETNSELMLEPKTEYDDNDNSVEDITLDDDDEDYSQAGTSQMDNSQGNFGNWQQMVGDQTGDEVFSGQDSGAQNSQDVSKSRFKIQCSTSLVKDLSSINTDDTHNDLHSSTESLSRHSPDRKECMNDTEPVEYEYQDKEKNKQENVDQIDDNPADETDVAEETDIENADEIDTDSVKTKAVQKKSTAITNIFKSTLAKNKPTLKIKLKKQDIIDNPSTAQPMSLRQNVAKSVKKCCYGCKDKKIIAKEEPKSKVLSKLKIFNRSKYNNIIVESPKPTPSVPFIKKLKIRNAPPPKEIPETTKIKPIKLILKRNTEFVSPKEPPQCDIESDIEITIQEPSVTNKRVQISRYAEPTVVRDANPLEENCTDAKQNTESEPIESSEYLEPFDPEKEFECSDDSESDTEGENMLTCAHCYIYETLSKKDLINHYKTCNSLCPTVLCNKMQSKNDKSNKKNSCTHCNMYITSSKTLLRNHIKACKFKPVAQRGRPKKIKEPQEMDSCKFCNFQHPDVNVFLRHLRFCNAASAPSPASAVQVDETGTQIHKCTGCSYVNTNLNIFMYHLKLCNKNYINLSLKDMLLKYKERPNIIGYSKPSTTLEVASCDDIKNIPSSSNKILPSVSNNVHSETKVLSKHLPSLFDPVDDYNSSYGCLQTDSDCKNAEKFSQSNEKVLKLIDPLDRPESSAHFTQGGHGKTLDNMKPLKLSESSCSESIHIASQSISKSSISTSQIEEETVAHEILGENEEIRLLDNETKMSSHLERSHVLNECVPSSDQESQAEFNVGIITSESPVEILSEIPSKEDTIPDGNIVCTAQSTKETVLEEQTTPLDTCEAPMSAKAVTTENLSELHCATTIFTESLIHSPKDNTKQEVLALLDDTLAEALSQHGLEANDTTEKGKALEDITRSGQRRLSFEHFENIASSYYAGHSNSDDEPEDELIRIDPNDDLNKQKSVCTDLNENTQIATGHRSENELDKDDVNLIRNASDNNAIDQKTKDERNASDKNVINQRAKDEKNLLGMIENDSMIIDSEGSEDEKEEGEALTLDLGSIHDSLSTANSVLNPNEGDDTLTNVPIPNDDSTLEGIDPIDDLDISDNEGSKDQVEDDDEDGFDSQRICLNCKSFESEDINILIAHIKACSNVNSDDDSDECESDETDETEEINEHANALHQDAVDHVDLKESDFAQEMCDQNVDSSRKRKLSEAERDEDELVFKVPKTIPAKSSDSERQKNPGSMEPEIEIKRYSFDDVGHESVLPVQGNIESDGFVEKNDVNEGELMENATQDGEDDSELFCSHCNQFSTFEVDELLYHFKQCTAVINEPGATPYISSEINELAAKYDSDDCKQIINAKYTNILLDQEHTPILPLQSGALPSESGTPTGFPAESPRYMTELTNVMSSQYTSVEPDATNQINEDESQS